MNAKTKAWLTKLSYFTVVVLVSVVTVSTPFLLFERTLWEEGLSASSSGLGYAHAEQAFRRSEVRLLELKQNGDYSNTGRKEGEFEIWNWPSYRFRIHLPFKLLEQPFKVESESYVDGWNKAMHRMVDEKRNHNPDSSNGSNKENPKVH